jgi:hypothetical protein
MGACCNSFFVFVSNRSRSGFAENEVEGILKLLLPLVSYMYQKLQLAIQVLMKYKCKVSIVTMNDTKAVISLENIQIRRYA